MHIVAVEVVQHKHVIVTCGGGVQEPAGLICQNLAGHGKHSANIALVRLPLGSEMGGSIVSELSLGLGVGGGLGGG